MDIPEKKRILVIIVTFNAMYWIDNCLGSLKKSSVSLSSIVIDNNSQDETVDHIKHNYPEVKLIQNKQNLGFGKANNIGLKCAVEKNFDYAFLLNQDAWIFPDTIAKLIGIHSANKKFGIISPVQLNGKGNNLDKNFSTYIPFETIAEIKETIKSRRTSFVETSFVNAASWLITKDCILSLGGFDPLFIHYGEDRDYCYRAMHHGFKIGIALNTTICHDRFYAQDNPYRKSNNLLFSVGLAHIKNVNHTLFYNYLSWIVLRMKKTLKWILLFNFKSLSVEINTSLKLFLMIKKIVHSRKTCIKNNSTFLRKDDP